MQYLNFSLAILDSERVIDATLEHVGIWLMLMRYCAGQENSGRIRGAGKWGDAKCRVSLHCPREKLDEPSSLWHWKRGNLVVELYPRQMEELQRARREGGAKGGRISGQRRRELAGEPERNGPPPESSEKQAPSREEALEFAKGVPVGLGEMSGLPAYDPEWVGDWWQWRSNSAKGWDQVRSWQRLMAHDWRRQFRAWEKRKMAAASAASGGIAAAFASETPPPTQKVKVL